MATRNPPIPSNISGPEEIGGEETGGRLGGRDALGRGGGGDEPGRTGAGDPPGRPGRGEAVVEAAAEPVWLSMTISRPSFSTTLYRPFGASIGRSPFRAED